MSAQAPSNTLHVRHILNLLKKKWALWVIPTMLFTAAAAAYTTVRTPNWKASQAIFVRDEAVGSRQGRFDSVDAMKTAQETIMEVSKNRQVLAAALQSVNGREPTKKEVGTLQDSLAIRAPKGAEFGRTEVIYLSVKADTSQKALQQTDAVCTQLEKRLQAMRSRRAQSVIAELEKTVQLTQVDLEFAAKNLGVIESEVGSDLGELRILNDTGAGDSNLRAAFNEIKTELRQAESQREKYEQLQQMLATAIGDPNQIVATPNQLLETLPALRRLKDGIVDAQLRTAQLLGKMNKDHPLVQAALVEEQEVRGNLHAELELAVRDLSAQSRISEARIRSINKQLDDVRDRLGRLAGLRARYNILTADVQQKIKIVEQAQTSLADARASQNAAEAASLLSRLDGPIVGNAPVGPSNAVIVLCGFLSGLATGLGLVTLTSPFSVRSGRRLTDYLGIGRRATDRPGTRTTDMPLQTGADRRAFRRSPETSSHWGGEQALQQQEDRRRQPAPQAEADRSGSGSAGSVAPSVEEPAPSLPVNVGERHLAEERKLTLAQSLAQLNASRS